MHLICPQPQILNNLCFSFLLGITAVPRETESNAYAKFWGANKVHYSRYAEGVCQALGQRKRASSENASKQITESLGMRVGGGVSVSSLLPLNTSANTKKNTM